MGQTDAASRHRRATRESFARQAEGFEDGGWVFTDGDVLAWIAGHTPVRAGDRILDVAGGTGAVGRHLSRDAAAGTVVADLVPEMLAAGAAAAAQEGRRDVLFVRADATDLPFADGQFDVAVTRLALHHMDAPATALREMARVCRAQARVTVVDMVAAPGAVGDRHNELERLRDPSHTRALRRAELTELVRRAGIAVDAESEREHAMSAERWLARCRPPGQAERTITAALLAEARGGDATGLRAAFEDDRLTIRQTWVLIGGTTGR